MTYQVLIRPLTVLWFVSGRDSEKFDPDSLCRGKGEPGVRNSYIRISSGVGPGVTYFFDYLLLHQFHDSLRLRSLIPGFLQKEGSSSVVGSGEVGTGRVSIQRIECGS